MRKIRFKVVSKAEDRKDKEDLFVRDVSYIKDLYRDFVQLPEVRRYTVLYRPLLEESVPSVIPPTNGSNVGTR